MVIAGVSALDVNNVLQGGTMVAIVGLLIKAAGPWRQQTIDKEKAIREEQNTRISELKGHCTNLYDRLEALRKDAETAVRECREDCDKETARLQQELLGRDRQRIQEQISLISAILSAVGDNPQLTTLLKTFESVQSTMRLNQR